MEKNFSKENSEDHFFQFATQPWPMRSGLAAAILMFLAITSSLAQAPKLQYSTTSATFTPNRAITPLTPTATGVATYGYANTAELFGPNINQPNGIALDAKGNMYIADTHNNQVKKVELATGQTVVLGSGFNLPYAVAVDSTGNVYVADYGNNAVKEIRASDGTTINLGSGFNKPSGVAVDAWGNVYVADAGNNTVKEIRGSDHAIISYGPGFKNPLGVAVDYAGDIYVADYGNGMLKRLPAGGGPATILTTVPSPMALTVDEFGDVSPHQKGCSSLSRALIMPLYYGVLIPAQA
jgi:sugar lactone lactonase YvrE